MKLFSAFCIHHSAFADYLTFPITQPPSTTMNSNPSEKKILDALRATMGKVCLAAEKLGCLPDVIYLRARDSRRIRETIRFYRGKLLDAAESAVWKAILDGESWAVRLALTLWGKSREFSDGAEVWYAPYAPRDPADDDLVRKMVLEMLNHNDYVEDCRTRRIEVEPGPVCGPGEPGPLENGEAPGGDRPGDRRDDLRGDGADLNN